MEKTSVYFYSPMLSAITICSYTLAERATKTPVTYHTWITAHYDADACKWLTELNSDVVVDG